MKTHSVSFKFYRVEFDDHWKFKFPEPPTIGLDQIFEYKGGVAYKSPASAVVHYRESSGTVLTATVSCEGSVVAFIHRDVVHFFASQQGPETGAGIINVTTVQGDTDI